MFVSPAGVAKSWQHPPSEGFLCGFVHEHCVPRTYHNICGCLTNADVFEKLDRMASNASQMTFYENSLRQWLVLLCAPWATYIVRRCEANEFFEIPQIVAQHNLLFGVILIGYVSCLRFMLCAGIGTSLCLSLTNPHYLFDFIGPSASHLHCHRALSPPQFFTRFLVACLYCLGGVNNIIMWDYQSSLTIMKLQNIFPQMSGSLGIFVFGAATAMQLLASIAFMLGFYTKEMSCVLLVFLAVVTIVVHDFWTIPDSSPAPYVKK